MAGLTRRTTNYVAESDDEADRPPVQTRGRPSVTPSAAAPPPAPRVAAPAGPSRSGSLLRVEAFAGWLASLDLNLPASDPDWLDKICSLSHLFPLTGPSNVARATVEYFKIFGPLDFPHIFMLSCLNYSRTIPNPFAALGARAMYLIVLWTHSFLVCLTFRGIWSFLLGLF